MKQLKLKKEIKIIIFSLIILLIATLMIIGIYFTLTHFYKQKKFAGTLVSQGIYTYDIKVNSEIEENDSYTIYYDNEYVYYLNSSNPQSIYRVNVYTNETTLMGTANADDAYCSLNDGYIECYSNDDLFTQKHYDLSFNKLNLQQKVKNSNIVYYDKETIVETDNNDIYVNGEKKFTLENDEYVLHSLKANDNIYILYKIIQSDNVYFIHDINNNKTEEYEYQNASKYKNGFLFKGQDKKKFIINYNTNTSREFEYESYNYNDYYSSEDVTDDGQRNIYRDSIYYIMENNITGEYARFTLGGTEDANSNIYLTDNYLVVIEENNKIYLVNLNEIKLEYNTVENFKKTIIKENKSIINTLKENYNISIVYGDDAVEEYDTFSANPIYDEIKINEVIKTIEKFVSNYNKDIFKHFLEDDHLGLTINLTSLLFPKEGENTVSSAAAYSYIKDERYLIVLDATKYSIEDTLTHELFHSFESYADTKNYLSFNELYKYNGKYTYSYDYANYESLSTSGTITNDENEDVNKVYFISIYSKTNPLEDKATLYTDMCAPSSERSFENYPNLKKKAIYIKTELLKYIPELADMQCLINTK